MFRLVSYWQRDFAFAIASNRSQFSYQRVMEQSQEKTFYCSIYLLPSPLVRQLTMEKRTWQLKECKKRPVEMPLFFFFCGFCRLPIQARLSLTHCQISLVNVPMQWSLQGQAQPPLFLSSLWHTCRSNVNFHQRKRYSYLDCSAFISLW